MGMGRMLVDAAGRFLRLLVGVSAVTALGGLAVGAIAGESLDRSISVGFYVVGSFLLVAGFFVGIRGPVRPKNAEDGFALAPFLGSRSVRWATREEQQETINLSAIFVVVGFVLVMIGIAVDSRYGLA
jgi:hypothetical protein